MVLPAGLSIIFLGETVEDSILQAMALHIDIPVPEDDLEDDFHGVVGLENGSRSCKTPHL